MIENTQKNLNEETYNITFTSKSCHNFVYRWLNRLNLDVSHLEILLSKYGNIKLPALLGAYKTTDKSIKCKNAPGKNTTIILSSVILKKSKITFKTDSFEKVFEINNVSDTFTITPVKTVITKDDKKLEDIHTSNFAVNICFDFNNVLLRLTVSTNEYYIRDSIKKKQNDFYDFLFNIKIPFNPIEIYEGLKNLFSLYTWWHNSTITLAEYPGDNDYARSKDLNEVHTQENMIMIENGRISELQIKNNDSTFWLSNIGEWRLSKKNMSISKTFNGEVIYNGCVDYKDFSSVNLQADFDFGESLFEKFKKYVQ